MLPVKYTTKIHTRLVNLNYVYSDGIVSEKHTYLHFDKSEMYLKFRFLI